MGLTKAQRYNRMLDKRFADAITAMQKHCAHPGWYHYDGILGYESMKCKVCGIDENDLEETTS